MADEVEEDWVGDGVSLHAASLLAHQMTMMGYKLRKSGQNNLQLIVRQLPSMGLSFQLWPAASALCWFLEEVFGEVGMYGSCLPELSCLQGEIGLGAAEVLTREKDGCLASSSAATDSGAETTRMRVLELGAGTGLVGILAAFLGADVTLTDLPHVIPNLLHNVRLNDEAIRGCGRGGSIRVEPLRWGECADIQDLGHSFDLIVASDVVYDVQLFGPLLQTLKWLVLGEDGGEGKRLETQGSRNEHQEKHELSARPFVLLSHVRRWKKDAHFFKKARKCFNVRVLHNHPHPANTRTGVAVYGVSQKALACKDAVHLS